MQPWSELTRTVLSKKKVARMSVRPGKPNQHYYLSGKPTYGMTQAHIHMVLFASIYIWPEFFFGNELIIISFSFSH